MVGAVVLVLVALMISIIICSITVVFGSKHRITNVELGDGYVVRLWTETMVCLTVPLIPMLQTQTSITKSLQTGH